MKVHKYSTAQLKSASSYLNKSLHAHCARKTTRHTWLLLFAAELVWAMFEERESKKAWSANELPQLIPSFAPSVIIWNEKNLQNIFHAFIMINQIMLFIIYNHPNIHATILSDGCIHPFWIQILQNLLQETDVIIWRTYFHNRRNWFAL